MLVNVSSFILSYEKHMARKSNLKDPDKPVGGELIEAYSRGLQNDRAVHPLWGKTHRGVAGVWKHRLYPSQTSQHGAFNAVVVEPSISIKIIV